MPQDVFQCTRGLHGTQERRLQVGGPAAAILATSCESIENDMLYRLRDDHFVLHPGGLVFRRGLIRLPMTMQDERRMHLPIPTYKQ